MLFWMPNISSASLVINEIAWQGYLGDANNEWIELYNEGSETINLDGWLLEASDGAPSINLSGISVNPSEYILLERTDDSTVPEETASKFYSGALSNEGEDLVLKNSVGTVIDSANFSSGWGEMQSSSTGTLSRFGSSWREGEATPKSQNISLETETDDDEEDESEDGDSENEEEGEEEVATTTKSSSSSIQEKTKKTAPKGTIEAVKQSFVGVPVLFESFLTNDDNTEIRKGIYAWNMGDGTVLYKTKKEDFAYIYQYPGEYVVTLSYYRFTFGKDLSELDPYIYDEHIISITDHSLVLETFKTDGTIVLKNTSSHTLDMSYWSIQSDSLIFTIPKYTLVRAGKTITFPGSVTKLQNSSIVIKDARGEMVPVILEENKSPASEVEKSSTVSKIQDTKTSPVVTDNFIESNTEDAVSLVSYSDQKTMYVGLFALLAVLISIIIWILFNSKKQSQEEISGYEVIEE